MSRRPKPLTVPDGFLRFSDAISRLAKGMGVGSEDLSRCEFSSEPKKKPKKSVDWIELI
jgi:hypothetical protein